MVLHLADAARSSEHLSSCHWYTVFLCSPISPAPLSSFLSICVSVCVYVWPLLHSSGPHMLFVSLVSPAPFPVSAPLLSFCFSPWSFHLSLPTCTLSLHQFSLHFSPVLRRVLVELLRFFSCPCSCTATLEQQLRSPAFGSKCTQWQFRTNRLMSRDPCTFVLPFQYVCVCMNVCLYRGDYVKKPTSDLRGYAVGLQLYPWRTNGKKNWKSNIKNAYSKKVCCVWETEWWDNIK